MSQVRTNSIVPVEGIPAGASGGGIIQVVSVVKTDTFSTSSTTYTDLTGLSATITPRSASNKILVLLNGIAGMNAAISGYIQLVRGTTPLCIGDSTSGYTSSSGPSFYGGSNDGNNNETFAIVFLDSPATTSATTYKAQVYAPQGGILRINTLGSDQANQVYSSRSASSITLMEVSG